MSKTRRLTEEEIADSTGARVAAAGASQEKYEVQIDGAWVEVDHHSYERVREIQDSCA